MTLQLTSIFKKSFLVTSIGLGLAACGGGNGLSNNGGGDGGGGPVDCKTTNTCPPPPPCETTNTCPTPPANVRDYGGLNGKIVWDASHDWFVVGTDGTLYAYNMAAGWPDEDSDQVPADRMVIVKGVTVTDDDAIFKDGTQIGSIAADQTAGGDQFYVLSFGTGTEQGYLDIDFNKNYRGVAPDDKTDAHITQIKSVAVQKSFQGLLENSLWSATDGDVIPGSNLESIAATKSDLNFSFAAAASGDYQFVLREYDHPYTDLDLRLIDTATGRILASSYGTLSGELISFPLQAGTTYGVNVNRQAGSEDTSFILSIKQTGDTDSTTGIALPSLTASGTTIRGTIHPITRFEFCSRFPTPGWSDVSSDASTDASSDSLFLALLTDASGDASSDASGDSTSDAQPNQPDYDEFSFSTISAWFTYTVINEGGEALTHIIKNPKSNPVQYVDFVGENPIDNAWYSPSLGIYHTRVRPVTIQVGDNGEENVDTIEYEILINPTPR